MFFVLIVYLRIHTALSGGDLWAGGSRSREKVLSKEPSRDSARNTLMKVLDEMENSNTDRY